MINTGTMSVRARGTAQLHRNAKPSACTFSAPRARVLARARLVDDDEDMEDKVAAFLAEQDMNERGVDAPADPTKVIGAEDVNEEQAKAYCRDITRVLRMLKEKRDMDVNEAKLVVQVEDPRNDDARRMGIEDSSGVSRDEMANALMEVSAGKVPTDRIALRVLHAELTNWPFLKDDDAAARPAELEASPAPVYSEEDDRSDAPGWRQNQAKPPMGRDPTDKPQGLQDMMPEWMGYGAIYAFTLIPVLILGTTVAVLFFSSLK